VWWSWLLEHFGAAMLHHGVADGLARLKRAVETDSDRTDPDVMQNVKKH